MLVIQRNEVERFRSAPAANGCNFFLNNENFLPRLLSEACLAYLAGKRLELHVGTLHVPPKGAGGTFPFAAHVASRLCRSLL